MLIVAVAGVAGWVLSLQIARSEAIDEAAHRASAMAHRFAAPYVAADPAAPNYAKGLRKLDKQVRLRLADGTLLRVKIWSADGTIVYSDETRLVGRQFDLQPNQKTLFVTGGADAELSDLDSDENVLDRDLGKDAEGVVEVYAAFESTDGRRLVFEAYLPVEDLLHHQNEILVHVLPLALGGPLVVALLLFPLAVHMSRRVREAERDSIRALRRVFEAAAAERRRLCRGLHDNAIPELVSVGLALEAMSLAGQESPERDQLDRLAATVRSQVDILRGILKEESEASVARLGLVAAIESVADRCRGEGLEVVTDLNEVGLDEAASRLAQAVVSEALRNVRRHSAASSASVGVHRDGDLLVVEVTDNGVGLDPIRGQVHPDHGLGLLADTVAELGGQTRFENQPDGGASIMVQVPCRRISEGKLGELRGVEDQWGVPGSPGTGHRQPGLRPTWYWPLNGAAGPARDPIRGGTRS